MNRSVLMIVLLTGIGFGAFAFLDSEDPPDTQQAFAKSLEDVKSEQEKAAATVPRKRPTGDFPVASKEGPWPKVVASDLTFSFGRMQVKTTKSHSFTIRNEGEADLQLTAGTTTCKCTQFDFDPSEEADVKSEVVKPGESVELIMSWKAGDHADRGFRHGGDIHTNDPKRPLINYTVEGAIAQLERGVVSVRSAPSVQSG